MPYQIRPSNKVESMEAAAEEGDIDKLYALLKEDGEVLEGYEEKAFINTPLHIAAAAGRTNFTLEMLCLKPSFGKKLNPEGLSPLHLALIKGHTNTVERLAKCEPQLIRVRGRGGNTPLHCVAKSGDFHLLAEFLIACPASVEDLTFKGETAVHVAVRNGSFEAFKVLLGWLRHTGNLKVLSWKDENGDTALHAAVDAKQLETAKQLEMLQSLIGKVNINEKNWKGLTVLDIANTTGQKNEETLDIIVTDEKKKEIPQILSEQENKEISETLKWHGAVKGKSVEAYKNLADFLTSTPMMIQELIVGFDVCMEKGLSGDIRNALLVVAVLIATATYQALLQPPGGLTGDDDDDTNKNATSWTNKKDPGKVVMQTEYFYVFIILNSIAFAASLGMIIALLPRNGYFMMLYVSLWFMFVNYMCSGLVISPETESTITLGALQAAFGLYILILVMRLRLPNRLRNFLWVWNKWSKAYHHRQMARSMLLLKYSQQPDN